VESLVPHPNLGAFGYVRAGTLTFDECHPITVPPISGHYQIARRTPVGPRHID